MDYLDYVDVIMVHVENLYINALNEEDDLILASIGNKV